MLKSYFIKKGVFVMALAENSNRMRISTYILNIELYKERVLQLTVVILF